LRKFWKGGGAGHKGYALEPCIDTNYKGAGVGKGDETKKEKRETTKRRGVNQIAIFDEPKRHIIMTARQSTQGRGEKNGGKNGVVRGLAEKEAQNEKKPSTMFRDLDLGLGAPRITCHNVGEGGGYQ